jgi:hypothetical protein
VERKKNWFRHKTLDTFLNTNVCCSGPGPTNTVPIETPRGYDMNSDGKKHGPQCLVGIIMALISLAAPLVAQTPEDEFMRESDRAMKRMDANMMVPASGNIDHDFVGMMVPHHQGAIDMAVAELRYGHNEQLRRIAQEIIVDQRQEIAAMRLAIGEPLPPSLPSPTRPSAMNMSNMAGSPLPRQGN